MMQLNPFSGAPRGRSQQLGATASRREYDPDPIQDKFVHTSIMGRGGEIIFFSQTFFSYSWCPPWEERFNNEIGEQRSRGTMDIVIARTLERFVQVRYLDYAYRDRLAILEVLLWELHLAVQRHVEDDELHIGVGHAF